MIQLSICIISTEGGAVRKAVDHLPLRKNAKDGASPPGDATGNQNIKVGPPAADIPTVSLLRMVSARLGRQHLIMACGLSCAAGIVSVDGHAVVKSAAGRCGRTGALCLVRLRAARCGRHDNESEQGN